MATTTLTSIPANFLITREEKEKRIQLYEWGEWSKGGLPDGVRRSKPTPAITDDKALNIDKQVAALPEGIRYVIEQIFKYEVGVNELAKKCRVSNRVIMEYRNEGINILWGALKALDQVH